MESLGYAFFRRQYGPSFSLYDVLVLVGSETYRFRRITKRQSVTLNDLDRRYGRFVLFFAERGKFQSQPAQARHTG